MTESEQMTLLEYLGESNGEYRCALGNLLLRLTQERGIKTGRKLETIIKEVNVYPKALLDEVVPSTPTKEVADAIRRQLFPKKRKVKSKKRKAAAKKGENQ